MGPDKVYTDDPGPCQPPGDYAGMTASPMEAGPPRRRSPNPERTRELMQLAQSIATLVTSQVPPGRERCKLRSMVEFFLDH